MDDDVIGVSGNFNQSGELIYVDDIHFPPLSQHKRRRAGEDQAVSAAFISDLHLGSKTFLAPQWEKMIQWFHTDPLAQTVRYLVISGDGVDGVGIYPGQDKHLDITDLFNQYSKLGQMLQELPDWVGTFVAGQHDAVRPQNLNPPSIRNCKRITTTHCLSATLVISVYMVSVSFPTTASPSWISYPACGP